MNIIIALTQSLKNLLKNNCIVNIFLNHRSEKESDIQDEL